MLQCVVMWCSVLLSISMSRMGTIDLNFASKHVTAFADPLFSCKAIGCLCVYILLLFVCRCDCVYIYIRIHTSIECMDACIQI